MVFAGDPGYPPNQQYNRRAEHFLPRLGLVWDPFGDGKTSIRVSYGLLYDTPHMFFYTRVGNNPPWGATTTLSGEQPLSNPWATYPGGNPFVTAASAARDNPIGFFPAGRHLRRFRPESGVAAGQYLESVDSDGRSASGWFRALIWATIRRTLVQPGTGPATIHPRDRVRRPIRADRARDPARAPTARIKTRAKSLTLLNPTWGPSYNTIAYLDAGATGSYNAMILSAQHRLANHFSMLANWTYSHCIADPSTTELTGPSYVNPNNRSADRSNCSRITAASEHLRDHDVAACERAGCSA